MPVKNPTDTTASVTLDGEQRPTIVPTTILSARDAELLRDYKVFLEARQLQEALFCPECYQSAEEGAKIRLSDKQVAVLCRHRLLFFQGTLPPVTRFDAMLQAQAQQRVLKPLAAALALTDAPPEETLFRTEAMLLRAYRALLLRQHLREALTCLTCWGNSYREGCRAYVTPDAIGIICRHRHLTYSGQTL